MEREDAESEVIGGSLNECDKKQDAWLSRTDATLQAYATVIQEGQQLAGLLRQQAATEDAENSESIRCTETMLGEIEKVGHNESQHTALRGSAFGLRNIVIG